MEPIRLDKRLSALLGIPRGEARRYIEGGGSRSTARWWNSRSARSMTAR
jgi:hypothetical protein